jgi:hypothetical protein
MKNDSQPEKISLSLWDRGVKVQSAIDSTKYIYLWFYEWHLFDAVKKGEHTSGRKNWIWKIKTNKRSAQMDGGWIKLKLDAVADGADIILDVTNRSDHDWPDIAAIIPCFNPGSNRGNTDAVPNPYFFDDTYQHTWFKGEKSLALLGGNKYPREIHFNELYIPSILAWKKELGNKFVFSEKWPTSKRNAGEGLIIRESIDHDWIAAIAWGDFLSVQGHNPWRCMHLSIRVGPLKKGANKIIEGKIYLFKGTKEEGLSKYMHDFKAM